MTIYKGSRRARNGIEWSKDIADLPTIADTLPVFTLSYTFDKLPLTLNELMEAHKQVSADVLVHSALGEILLSQVDNHVYNWILTDSQWTRQSG